MASEDFQLLHPHFTYFNYTFHPHSLSLLLIVFVFVALLLLALLSCYFHSRFCYGNFTINNNNNTVTASSLHPIAHSAGLDSDTISSMPTVIHSVLSDKLSGLNINGVEEKECSICLEMFEDEETIKVLSKCNHAYHSECVDKWFTTGSSCPLCRDSLLVESPQGEVAIAIA